MQIHIKDLRLRTIIGIFPWEKKNKQDVVLNIKITFHGEQAGLSDKIADTLDYKTITKKIIHLIENNRFELIESMVNQVLDIIMDPDRPNHELIEQAFVEIDKPGALRFADSVSISNTRHSNKAQK